MDTYLSFRPFKILLLKATLRYPINAVIVKVLQGEADRTLLLFHFRLDILQEKEGIMSGGR